MPDLEPTAEPGMLPEIIEEPQQRKAAPVPEPAAEPQPKPNRKSPSPIAPEPESETSETFPKSSVQPPADSAKAPLAVPDTVEEFAPPSEPKATPVPETRNTLESRQRSRQKRDPLLRRTPLKRETEPEASLEPPSLPPDLLSPAEPEASTIPDDAADLDDVPASPEPSQEITEGNSTQSEVKPNSPKISDDLPEEEESPLESLEEESDVI